jgi:hypothetical protein
LLGQFARCENFGGGHSRLAWSDTADEAQEQD